MTALSNDATADHEESAPDWQDLRRRRHLVNQLRQALEVPDLPLATVTAYRPHAAALSERISTRIGNEVAAFRAAPDPRVRETITAAIAGAVDLFVDILADTASQRSDIYAIFRNLGAVEGLAGHNLDAMHAAHHIATQESWAELRQVTSRLDLPDEVVARLTGALLRFQSQLIDQATAGHHAVLGGMAPARYARARLLTMLLSDRPGRLERLAANANWTIPQLTAVAATRAGTDTAALLAEFPAALARVRHEVLLIVADSEEIAVIVRWLAGRTASPIAIGWGGPPQTTYQGARWTVRALHLAHQGIIAVPDDQLVWCHDHQSTLCMHADPALRRHADADLLAPLLAETPKRRLALAETMLLWLQARPSAPDMARRLGVHDQTVRHRLRHIKVLFADELADPSQTVGLLTALESATPRWRKGST